MRKIITNFQSLLTRMSFSDRAKLEIEKQLKCFSIEQLQEMRIIYENDPIPQPLFIMEFLRQNLDKNLKKFYGIENGEKFHFFSESREQALIDVQVWGGELI